VKTNKDPHRRRQLSSLQKRLDEAEQTIAAIRRGEVDALVMGTPPNEKVYTLESADQAYRIFVENMAEGAATLTNEGTILYANKRFAELVETPLEQVVGSLITNFLAHEDLKVFPRLQRRLQAAGSRGEVRLVLHGGRLERTCHVALAPLPSEPGEIFCAVFTDLTVLKKAEEALQQAHNELELRVADRTRKLEEANQELRSQIKQREIAEAAVHQLQRLDAIGQITSGVAHDFNNLLTIVLNNARLLSRKVRDQDDQEGIELIRTAAERGAQLIGELLAFSRKQRLEPQMVDLNSKIMGMADLLSATLGGTVHLNTTLAPHLWLALADPTQIELIVLNLAINARDAMKSGGTLTLETFNAVIESEPSRPEEPFPGNYVCLAVNDTGIGIPDNVLPRVLEPFFTTKEPGKGSGLGLAQVFGFAKQSGGGVRIETRLGEGTSVTVFLPRAEVNAVEREKEPARATMDPHTEQKSNILVVDDDRSVLRSTIRMLRFLGFAAAPADSAKEALRKIASEPGIDLVLADVAMPEMSGVELAGAIHETRPTLPVILVTGYRDLDALQEFGESRTLQKPYTESELTEKITAALT
jgi:PAS domain S-box-containing protein